MVEDVKLALRLKTDAFDSEVEMLVDAAKADMLRVGVDPSVVNEEGMSPLVRHAITCYCKSHFGFDNDEAERFDRSYRQIVCDLLHSEHNVAAISQAEGEQQ